MIILLLFCLFWFNRGYSVNNRLDFVLIVIKQDYNAYNRLKFILSFIRQENGLNDRSKLVKKGRKETKSERNKDEIQKTRNELKVSELETYPLKNEERMKNDEERRKTFTDLLTETSRKRYESTSAWIFFTETIFSPKTAEMHS